MRKALLILSLLAAIISSSSCATTIDADAFSTLWNAWKTLHGRIYSPDQEQVRFSIFVDNYHQIQAHNSQGLSTKWRLNKFADLTVEEFAQLRGEPSHKPKTETRPERLKTAESSTFTDLPTTLDWRKQGAVTPVKDQGINCNSSYTFAAVGGLEGYLAINHQELIPLSAQQILDCYTDTPTPWGCQDGLPYSAVAYSIKHGLEREESYPYTGVEGTCKYNASNVIDFSDVGIDFLEHFHTLALKKVIEEQTSPVDLAITLSQWQHYSSGVMTVCDEGDYGLNVLIVGWDVVDGKEGWIVKIPWGTDWGLDGYVLLTTDENLNFGWGACGILGSPVKIYPKPKLV